MKMRLTECGQENIKQDELHHLIQEMQEPIEEYRMILKW